MHAYSLSVWLASNTVPLPPIRLVQPLNISSDTVTASVFQSKLAKMVVSALQPLNIFSMLVTWAVLKLVRSSVTRLLHSLNISSMSSTLAVLKLVRSSVVNCLHPLNIPSMLVTSSVWKFSRPLKSVRLLMPLNHEYVVVGRMSLNEGSNTTCWTALRLVYQPGLLEPVFTLYA